MPSPVLMYWMNESRTCQVIVPAVTSTAVPGRASAAGPPPGAVAVPAVQPVAPPPAPPVPPPPVPPEPPAPPVPVPPPVPAPPLPGVLPPGVVWPLPPVVVALPFLASTVSVPRTPARSRRSLSPRWIAFAPAAVSRTRPAVSATEPAVALRLRLAASTVRIVVVMPPTFAVSFAPVPASASRGADSVRVRPFARSRSPPLWPSAARVPTVTDATGKVMALPLAVAGATAPAFTPCPLSDVAAAPLSVRTVVPPSAWATAGRARTAASAAAAASGRWVMRSAP